MKAGRLQTCIDFIRFNLENDGFVLDETQEEILSEILDGDKSADDVIQEIINNSNISTTFVLEDTNDGFYKESPKCQLNYFNIKDRNLLATLESKISAIRLAEILSEDLPTNFDFDLLSELHSRMFGDIYPNAGTKRTTKASKRTVFCMPKYLDSTLKKLFTSLKKSNFLARDTRDDFIDDLAYFVGELAAIHPFRDGNGRVVRVFILLLAEKNNYGIQWHKIDADRYLEADICAIDGDYQPLISVFDEVLYEYEQ